MAGKTIDMINEYAEDTASAYRKWKKNAKRELDYRLGYQWKPEDKAIVESEGRPALTFNEIQPIIRLISGYQKQNRKDIKVVGVEGGDDFIAHIMTLLIKNIMTRGYGEYKMSQMFVDGISTSKGWIEPTIVRDEDPVNGCIKMKNNLYYNVYPDPDYIEYDMSDAEFLIKPLRMTKARLLNLYPEYESKIRKVQQVYSPFDEIVSLEDDPKTGYEQERGAEEDGGIPYTRSERRKLYDLTICWYKKYEKKTYVVDTISGDFNDVTERNLTVRDQKQMLSTINKGGNEQIAFIHQRVGVPWVAIKSGNELLEDVISPEWPNVKTFPITPYVASFTPAGRTPEKIFQGLIGALIDPQNEENKRSSQELHLVNTSANSIWVGDADAFSNKDWEKFQANCNKAGFVARKKKGSELRRERAVNDGQLHGILSDKSSERLKRISGINPDLLAQQDKTTSGRALAIRAQQGIMIVQDVYDNQKYSRDILSKLLIGMILNNYTPEKVVRICGERQPVIEQVQDPNTGEMVEQVVDEKGEITQQEAEQVLNSFDMLKYDLAIDETQMSPIMRMAVSEELMQLREKGILPPGVADDLIVDGMSIPNKDEIKQRLKQFQSQMMTAAKGGGQGQ